MMLEKKTVVRMESWWVESKVKMLVFQWVDMLVDWMATKKVAPLVVYSAVPMVQLLVVEREFHLVEHWAGLMVVLLVAY